MSITYEQLKARHEPHFWVFKIDRYFGPKIRSFVRFTSSIFAIISFGLSFEPFSFYFGYFDGLFFVFSFIYLVSFFVEVFYHSMKNTGIDSRMNDDRDLDIKISFALSEILYFTDDIDMSRAFFETRIGKRIFELSGIEEGRFESFIFSKRVPVIATSIEFSEKTGLFDYVNLILGADKNLSLFIGEERLEMFKNAAKIVDNDEEMKRRRDRFWSRENLGIIPSIGSMWFFSPALRTNEFTKLVRSANIDFDDKTENASSILEEVLYQEGGGNAVIVDSDASIGEQVAMCLERRIALGTSLPKLEHCILIKFDLSKIILNSSTKVEIESNINNTLSKLNNKNIIYIEDFPRLIAEARLKGVSLPGILEPYFKMGIIFIITSTYTDHKFYIENSPILSKYFNNVINL